MVHIQTLLKPKFHFMNNESGVNTILLVIIVAMLVGGAVWFFMRGQSPDTESPSINVTLPVGTTPAE